MPVLDLSGREARWDGPELAAWARCVQAATTDSRRSTKGHPLARTLTAILDLPGVPFVTAGVRSTIATLATLRRVIVVERPGFGEIPRLFRRHGCQVVEADAASLVCAAEDPRQSLVWVTSPCRNPDGWCLDDDTAAELGDFVDAGGLVVQNESYRWFTASPGPRVHGAVLVGSLHKLAGSWSRLGWLMADVEPGLAADLPYLGPPALWQSAWCRFLADDAFGVLVERARRSTDLAGRARDLLHATPGHGPVALVSTPPDIPWPDRLAELGMRANPGTAFGATAQQFRLSFVGVDAAEVRWADVRRLADALSAPAPR